MPDPTLKEDIARLLTLAGEEDVEVGGESDPRGKAPSSGSNSPVDDGEKEQLPEPSTTVGGPDRDYGEPAPSLSGLRMPQTVTSRIGLALVVLLMVLSASFMMPSSKANGHRHHQPPPSPVAQPLPTAASAPKTHGGGGGGGGGGHATKSPRAHDPSTPGKPRKLSDQQPHQQPLPPAVELSAASKPPTRSSAATPDAHSKKHSIRQKE